MPPRRRGRARGRAHTRRGRVGRNGRAEGSDVEHSNREDAEVSQSANSDGHGASNMTLTQWLDMKLDKFDGSGTPMDASSWLRSMEKYMDASVMTQEDRVVYVAFQLKGLADIWWEGVRAAWTPAHGPPTWDVFVKQFTSKYYPDSFKEKMDVALRNIKQGDKTVDEYEMEFSKIVHFVDHINQNQSEKARRFFEGLNSEYRHVMGANRPNEYFSVVEQARGMELQIQLTQEEAARTSGTNGSSSKHKRSHHDGSELTERLALKKSKSSAHSQQSANPNQSGAYPFSAPHSNITSFIRPVPGQGLICFKCGQDHRASDCDFSGSCDHCGKTGHMKRVCKKNPNSIIKWQLTNPSVVPTIGLSTDDSSSRVRCSYGSVQMMTTSPATPLQFTSFPPHVPPMGYYYHAPTLPVPYGHLQLPAPPQAQQPVADSSASMPVGVYNKPSSSQGHHDGALGPRISGANINSSVERRG